MKKLEVGESFIDMDFSELEARVRAHIQNPHIYFKGGYWRVNPTPKPFGRNGRIWAMSHMAIGRLNQRISYARMRGMKCLGGFRDE